VPQDKSAKKSAITPLSLKVGDLLTGAYSASRMSQANIAAATGMSTVTLQKKLAGTSPITTTDLVLIAGAIPDTDAGAILETAISQLGGYSALLSAACSIKSESEQKKKQAEARLMATEQIEENANRAENNKQERKRQSSK